MVKAEILMRKYFTYKKHQDGYLVLLPSNTAIKYNYTCKKLLDITFKVTNQPEACILSKDNCFTTISLSLYAQLPDNENFIPFSWRSVIGVLVGTEKHAITLVDELEKARTWALLQR